MLPNGAHATDGLDRDLGPKTSAIPIFFGFTMGLPTAGGAVTITAMAENPSFTADLDTGINGSLPEPAALWLVAFSLAALGLMARRTPLT